MECLTIERMTIRCAVCDEIVSHSASRVHNKIALKSFRDIGLIVCDDCFDTNDFNAITGKEMGHGIIYVLKHRFNTGDDLKDYRKWILLQGCTDVKINC